MLLGTFLEPTCDVLCKTNFGQPWKRGWGSSKIEFLFKICAILRNKSEEEANKRIIGGLGGQKRGPRTLGNLFLGKASLRLAQNLKVVSSDIAFGSVLRAQRGPKLDAQGYLGGARPSIVFSRF